MTPPNGGSLVLRLQWRQKRWNWEWNEERRTETIRSQVLNNSNWICIKNSRLDVKIVFKNLQQLRPVFISFHSTTLTHTSFLCRSNRTRGVRGGGCSETKAHKTKIIKSHPNLTGNYTHMDTHTRWRRMAAGEALLISVLLRQI